MSRRSFIRLLGVGIFLISAIISTYRPVQAEGTPPDSPFLISMITTAYMLSAPGRTAEPMAVIPVGTAVPAIARTSTDSWILVQYNGLRGWVSVHVILSPDGDIGSLPLPTSNSFIPGAGNQVVGRAIINAAIRGGPGRQFQFLGRLHAGTSVILDGRSGKWVRFKMADQTEGWLGLSIISVTGRLSSLPNVTFP